MDPALGATPSERSGPILIFCYKFYVYIVTSKQFRLGLYSLSRRSSSAVGNNDDDDDDDRVPRRHHSDTAL